MCVSEQREENSHARLIPRRRRIINAFAFIIPHFLYDGNRKRKIVSDFAETELTDGLYYGKLLVKGVLA